MAVFAVAVMVVMMVCVLRAGTMGHVHLMRCMHRGPMRFGDPGNRERQKQSKPGCEEQGERVLLYPDRPAHSHSG